MTTWRRGGRNEEIEASKEIEASMCIPDLGVMLSLQKTYLTLDAVSPNLTAFSTPNGAQTMPAQTMPGGNRGLHEDP